MQNKTLIVIAGPTAVGKTSIGIKIAKHFNTQIVSADSRQCYQELNIGVARPSQKELNEVPHHLIASHSIANPLDAALYAKLAAEKLEAVFTKSNFAVLVGGTGLYIKALLEGIDDIPPIKQEIKEEITNQVALYGLPWLINQLETNDPIYISQNPTVNNYRYQRALGIFLSHGKSIISFQNKTKKSLPFIVIGYQLYLQRNQLYNLINQRVDQMIQQGLLDEVQNLMAFKENKLMHTIGYREAISFLEGETNKDQMVETIKQHTRNYAKRQITWFSHQTNFTSIIPNENAILQNMANLNANYNL